MPVACPLRSLRNRPPGRHAPARPHNRIGNATGGTDTRIYDNQNRPTEMNSSPVSRDALGNITEDHLGNEFGYDAWNRLTTHDATDRYGYDALNRRNRFATRDLHYDADGNIIEEREDGIVTLQHHYSKSGQGIVARRNFASGSYSSTYYAMTLTDGSVMTIISSTGVQLEHYVYNPNGLVEMYAEGEFGDWTHDPEMSDREGAHGWTVGWQGRWWDRLAHLSLLSHYNYSSLLSTAVSESTSTSLGVEFDATYTRTSFPVLPLLAVIPPCLDVKSLLTAAREVYKKQYETWDRLWSSLHMVKTERDNIIAATVAKNIAIEAVVAANVFLIDAVDKGIVAPPIGTPAPIYIAALMADNRRLQHEKVQNLRVLDGKITPLNDMIRRLVLLEQKAKASLHAAERQRALLSYAYYDLCIRFRDPKSRRMPLFPPLWRRQQ